jgi:acyl carrier protein
MSREDRVSHLRALWAEVLNVKTVSDGDYFLELGGDSIAATLCLNAVADEFDIDMPMGLLLEDNATFGGFVAAVDDALRAAESEPSVV